MGAEAYLPAKAGSLPALRRAAQDCRGCDLYAHASQTVFGAGTKSARLMLVGEQPGDKEDLAGEPFVGPAGHLLGRALADLGIERGDAYLTNMVKHFKFVPPERGKRRIHQKPSRAEVLACLPWLRAELTAVRPAVVVLLGATAAQALYGNKFRVSKSRGLVLDPPAALSDVDSVVVATVHPSAILRAPGDARRAEAYRAFVDDLGIARDELAQR